MDPDLVAAPEIAPPEGVETVFAEVCSESAIELQTQVWTRLLQ
jgi:hypothetical protein